MKYYQNLVRLPIRRKKMDKRQMDRCKYCFEELEKYFEGKIEEELESIE